MLRGTGVLALIVGLDRARTADRVVAASRGRKPTTRGLANGKFHSRSAHASDRGELFPMAALSARRIGTTTQNTLSGVQITSERGFRGHKWRGRFSDERDSSAPFAALPKPDRPCLPPTPQYTYLNTLTRNGESGSLLRGGCGRSRRMHSLRRARRPCSGGIGSVISATCSGLGVSKVRYVPPAAPQQWPWLVTPPAAPWATG